MLLPVSLGVGEVVSPPDELLPPQATATNATAAAATTDLSPR
jgi:hypothetical protein